MSSLQGVLGGLLLAGPAHGYRLQATLAGELGPLWVTRASQLYLTLGRMRRDGLVAAHRVRQATRPDRQIFELTPRGHAAARAWLLEPGDDADLVVRLAVARLLGAETFGGLAESASAARVGALRSLRALREQVAGGFQRQAVEAEVFRVQAELRWLAHVRDHAGEIAAAPRGARGGGGGGGDTHARPA
jgi:DNA-binding PadR family transcriptional regulator